MSSKAPKKKPIIVSNNKSLAIVPPSTAKTLRATLERHGAVSEAVARAMTGSCT